MLHVTDPGVDRAGNAVREAARDLLALACIVGGTGLVAYAAYLVSLAALLLVVGLVVVGLGVTLGYRADR